MNSSNYKLLEISKRLHWIEVVEQNVCVIKMYI